MWDFEYPSLDDFPWFTAPYEKGGAWTARLFMVNPDGVAVQIGSPFLYMPSRESVDRLIQWLDQRRHKRLETKE